MLRRSQHTRLRLERLEQKAMLAGDVSVVVSGDGDLLITGDAEENSLALESGDNPGEYLITDTNTPGTSTINGQDKSVNGDETFMFSGVTGDVLVDLKGGADTFRVFRADLPGKLVVHGGEGDDALFLGLAESSPDLLFTPVSFADDVKFYGGDGADSMQMRDFTIAKDLVFSGAAGDDLFEMWPELNVSTGSSVGDDAYVLGGDDADLLVVGDVAISDSLLIDADAGDDEVLVVETEVGASTLISLGSGYDFAEIAAVDVGHSMSILGSGTNEIFVAEVFASENLIVLTASGDDVVVLEGVESSLAVVITDGGSDDVSIYDSAFDLLYVDLGSGDDTLTIGGVEVSLLGLLSGGLGDDTLVDDGGNDFWFGLAISF